VPNRDERPHHIYAADWPCHVAVVRTSSGFPSAALPRQIVDFLAKLSTTSLANLHVQHGEQIFLLAFPSLIALDELRIAMRACRYTCESQSIPLPHCLLLKYIDDVMLTSCLSNNYSLYLNSRMHHHPAT
jgi:hypothetical protein